MIRLTDEEIDDIVIIPPLNRRSEEDLRYYSRKRDECLLQAQLKKVWDEWNMSVKLLIKHSSGAEGYDKEWVDKFWQALLEEIKE